MKKKKILVLCGLIFCLVYLIAIPTAVQAKEAYLKGKIFLAGPNGLTGCDCTKEVYVDCYCNIMQ